MSRSKFFFLVLLVIVAFSLVACDPSDVQNMDANAAAVNAELMEAGGEIAEDVDEVMEAAGNALQELPEVDMNDVLDLAHDVNGGE